MTAPQLDGYRPGDGFNRPIGNFMYGSQYPSAFSAKGANFVFRKRLERIDWKRLGL
jgi:hypothetical protein